MRTVLACALLVLLPLSSVRMVCFDSHSADARAGTTLASDDEAAAAAEKECERICARRHAPPRPAATTTTCVLVPDPNCSFLASAGVAVMPPEPTTLVAAAAHPFEPVAAGEYLAPLLPHDGPPPRA
jgi:hypothetical protein